MADFQHHHLSLVFCLGAALLTQATAQNTNSPAPGSEYKGVELEKHDKHATDGIPVQITVHENLPIKPFFNEIFGCNFDWEDSGDIIIDPKSGEIDSLAAKLLKGVPFPLNRFTGADSQQFVWKGAVGPSYSRIPQQLWGWVTPHPILAGPIEWWNWLKKADENATLTWVVNLDKTIDSSSAADIAAFLTGTAEPGSPWAQYRSELGTEKPVDVAIWELGNEMDWGNGRRWTVEQYIEACRKAIAEIRSVYPSAVFAAHAASAPWNPNWQTPGVPWQHWHREVIRQIGQDISYIVFHPYYQGYPTSVMEWYLDEITSDIKNITKEDRIKLFISEHARWPEQGRENWYQTHSIEGCVATAQFLIRCLNRPDVTAANYHSFSAGPWGMIYRDKKTGSLYTTGIADMFRLFGMIQGSSVVEHTIAGDGTDRKEKSFSFASSTIRDGDSLNLVISNLGGSRPVSWNFQSKYEVVESWLLSGATPQDHNTPENKGVLLNPLSIPSGEFSEIVVPATSVVYIKLQKLK